MTISLADKYRPATLDGVLGQPKVCAQVRSVLARGGFGGRGVWVTGPTGAGKTSLARIIGATLAHDSCTVETVARSLTPASLGELLAGLRYYGFAPGGRVLVCNEAHGLSRACIEVLLDGLENLPAHACVIFTTTKVGEERLFDDQIDASPLLARCLPLTLTSQGLSKVFAERILEVCRVEGLGSPTMAQAVRLVQDCKNSMRAALQEVDAGCFCDCGAAVAA